MYLHRQNSDRDKLVRIETAGCAVNIATGLHDGNGTDYISVEVVPREPDDDGYPWTRHGPETIIVTRGPKQVPDDPMPAGTTVAAADDQQGAPAIVRGTSGNGSSRCSPSDRS